MALANPLIYRSIQVESICRLCCSSWGLNEDDIKWRFHLNSFCRQLKEYYDDRTWVCLLELVLTVLCFWTKIPNVSLCLFILLIADFILENTFSLLQIVGFLHSSELLCELLQKKTKFYLQLYFTLRKQMHKYEKLLSLMVMMRMNFLQLWS